MPAASSTVVCASGTRSSSVPKRGCGRSSHHHELASAVAPDRRPQASAARYSPQIGQRRGHALAGELLGDLRPNRGQAAVAPAVKGSVGGERGDLGQQRAQRVVDAERSIGRADGDVDLERENELAPRVGTELRCRGLEAPAPVHLALLGGERMRPGDGEVGNARSGGGEVEAGGRELAREIGDASARLGDDLELARRELELEPRIAAQHLDHRRSHRCEVTALGVEQHQLLLDPHGQRVGGVEGALDLRHARHDRPTGPA